MSGKKKKVTEEEALLINSQLAKDKGFGIDVARIGEITSRRDLENLKKVGATLGVAKSMKVNPNVGLSQDEANDDYADRKAVYGTNTFVEPPAKNFFVLFFATFQDTTMIILTVAATISLILGVIPPDVLGGAHGSATSQEWIEGVAIYIAILIVASVTAGNNYSKDKQFRKLNKKKNNFKVTVIRAEVEQEIDNYDILAGDVVVLRAGGQIPADGLFISGFDLYVDESRVTGESDAVRKSEEKDPFMLSGCQITDGVGRMIVIAVGMNSEWGKTLAKLQEKPEETPLQKKLDSLAVLIGKVGTGVAVLVFIVLTIYWIVNEVANQPWEWAKLRGILQNFIIAVTIIVVAVPEGLPLAVTISLAYSMRQMMHDQNLVRHLEACETMGGATNICSDKTGTLTENRMTVVQGWIAGREFNQVPPKEQFSKPVNHLLTEGIAVNSTAAVSHVPGKPMEFIGNKTECALLVFNDKLGGDYKKTRDTVIVKKFYAFTSARKRMSAIISLGENGKPSSKPTSPEPEKKSKKSKKSSKKGKEDEEEEFLYGPHRIYAKGASEMVLKLCTRVLAQDGEIEPLSNEMRADLTERIETLASQGLRTLTLAYKDLDGEIPLKDAPENDLILIGVVGIMDPIRNLVPEAVRACQYAGIFVRMVTGDNILTAKKIAEDCGIYKPGGIALEGPVFAKMTDAELDKVIPDLQILARATPMDKFRLVERLKILNEVVAVTGDGTNDAPALKKADVGLAMGIAGTEIAKEASDIIILDDNFVSIVRSCMWGRNVYDNIRKFLQFQLTINAVALVLAFIGAVTQYGTPLKAVQLLWVNLIMDTMAALALGTEKPTPSLLSRKPYGRKSSLISRLMWRNIIGIGILQLGILFWVLYGGVQTWNLPEYGNEHHEKPTVHYTMVFNTFVFLQIFNEINSRMVHGEQNVFAGFITNPIFVGVEAFTIVGQVLITEFGGYFTMTTHLDWLQWISCVALGISVLPVGFLIRLIPIPLEAHEKSSISEDYQSELEFLTNKKKKGAAIPGQQIPPK